MKLNFYTVHHSDFLKTSSRHHRLNTKHKFVQEVRGTIRTLLFITSFYLKRQKSLNDCPSQEVRYPILMDLLNFSRTRIPSLSPDTEWTCCFDLS